MEREDFEAIRFDQHATLMWRRSGPDTAQAVEHFGHLRDAVDFARELGQDERKTAWIVLDTGLLAPEDLPRLEARWQEATALA